VQTPLTPDRWARVRELFDAVLELPSARRAAFLADRSDGDPALRAEVESLLAALERSADHFETPAAATYLEAEDEAFPGDGTLGRYRLVRKIGQGGMGAVYEAERADDEFRIRVAVKLIKRGMDTELVVRRFRQERQILAGLEHPNIARLLDGGVSESGQPYFVMEHVEGAAITAFCREHVLSLRERLELFLSVCEAVGYAHRNLVVHRDLKPSNILVTADGTPKLLDFGVAKLLRSDDEAGNTLTRAGQHAFTPEYASPEQLAGDPITTASDVYSLGVILYELLTGQRPDHGVGRAPDSGAFRRRGDTAPTRPSVVLSAKSSEERGYAAAAGLRRKLRGELDAIVMKALSPEPERRYLTVAALIDDLERFLDGRPVQARGDGVAYRARKFAGRHRVTVAAAALVLLSLIVGGVATVSQARRAEAARVLAEQRFQDLRGLTNAFVFEIHDAIETLPGSTAARALLINRSLEYLDRLALEADDDVVLQYELGSAYLRLGRIQGDPNHANLGDLAAAVPSFRRAATLLGAVVDRDPADLGARRALALTHEKLGDSEAWSGDVAAGLVNLHTALEHRRAIADTDPGDLGSRLEFAIALIKVGDLSGHSAFPNLAETATALARYDEAFGVLASLEPSDRENAAVRRYLAMLHERRGRMLHDLQRFDEALPDLAQSAAIRVALAGELPHDADVQRDAGIAHERLCSVELERGDASAALRYCEAAVAVYRRLRDTDPDNASSHQTHAIGQRWLARAVAAAGEPETALALLQQSTETLRALATADPENLTTRRQLARNHLHASLIHSGLARSSVGAEAARHLALAREYRDRGRIRMDESVGDGSIPPVDRLLLESADAKSGAGEAIGSGRISGPAPPG
jgi:eukaryotic-like serine/threonine-protein kinase